MSLTNGERWAQQHPQLAKVSGASRAKSLAQPTPPRRKRKVEALQLKDPQRAGDVVVIFLPLPPKELSPNSRTHWTRKQSIVRATRGIAKIQASKVTLPEPWTKAVIDLKVWSANRHDEDNLVASCKSLIDGVAEGLGINDRHFTIGAVRQFTGVKSEGRREVEIQITRLEP